METTNDREVPGELKKQEQHGTKRKLDQSTRCARQGTRGLRRPKHPLSFQIVNEQQSSANFTSKSSATGALENRIHLLNLIIRRNKNQHRSQSFFKCLCLLRRSLAKLLAVSSRLFDLSHTATSTRTSEQIRHNFEIEASLRSQKEVLEEHIREVLAPRCYVTFSGLVADSQFGNLGVVLVALLSEIVCGSEGVGPMKAIHDRDDQRLRRSRRDQDVEQGSLPDWSTSLIVTSTRATGEDQGEVVERVYDRDGSVSEASTYAKASTKAYRVATAQHDSDRSVTEDTPQEEVTSIQQNARTKETIAVNSVGIRQDSSSALKDGTISEETTATSRNKKKKRKNAIDDLFSGLS